MKFNIKPKDLTSKIVLLTGGNEGILIVKQVRSLLTLVS